jgi:ferritin-like metal-binding protein YciE
MAHKEMFMAWLKDAYAMEIALTETLERRVDSAEGHPQLQQRDKQHLEETRRHAEMVKSRIEALGEETSSIKSGMSKLSGMIQGMGTKATGDTLVKNSIADYASEHFEIASYRALMVAAREMGDHETAQMCEQILRDEESMASFLEQNLPMVVQETVRQEAAAHED